jgi:hypothetical protein
MMMTLLATTILARPVAAGEFPEVDVSVRWSTIGAFEPEFGFFAERHYVDRFNPEVGFHLLPFLVVTGEYAFSHMLRRSNLGEGDFDSTMTSHFRSHGFAIGARAHPPWRGALLPFAHVTFGVSTGTVTFDADGSGFHGYWSESSTRPELFLGGGLEVLFPRGVRERSHLDLGGKANRIIRNGTVGLVLEAGHTFAPAYEYDLCGELAVGQFTFDLGFIAHF